MESLIDRGIYIIPHVELDPDDIRPVDVFAEPLMPFIRQIMAVYKTDTEPKIASWIYDTEVRLSTFHCPFL